MRYDEGRSTNAAVIVTADAFVDADAFVNALVNAYAHRTEQPNRKGPYG